MCVLHYACAYTECMCIYIVHVHIHSYMEDFEGSWLPHGSGQSNSLSTHIKHILQAKPQLLPGFSCLVTVMVARETHVGLLTLDGLRLPDVFEWLYASFHM